MPILKNEVSWDGLGESTSSPTKLWSRAMDELKKLVNRLEGVITEIEDITINDSKFNYTEHSPMELRRLNKIISFIERKSRPKTCGWRNKK